MIAGLPAKVRALLRDEPVPDWRAPMLATLTAKRFSDPRWIFEPKLDGERCLAFRDGERVRLMSRNRKLLNATYPELVDALAAQDTARLVVDGEIVAFEGRRTSFARLQGRLGITDPKRALATGIPVFYYLFDLLHLDGYATTELPLVWRKRLLRDAVEFHDPLRCTTYCVKEGEAAYRAACARGDEGVIAKLAHSKYVGGRSTNWLKFKCVRDQEFVIGGYTEPKGSRVGLGALLVGYYKGRDLVLAGKVGHVTLHPRPGPRSRRPLGAPGAGRPGRFYRVDTRRQAAPPTLHRPAHRQKPRRGRQGDTLMPPSHVSAPAAVGAGRMLLWAIGAAERTRRSW
jgi:ATP-dependent DNA ligase